MWCVFASECCWTKSRTALHLFVPNAGLLSCFVYLRQPGGSLRTAQISRGYCVSSCRKKSTKKLHFFSVMLIFVCRLQQACVPRGPPKEVPQPGLQVSLQRPDASADPQSQFADHPTRPAVWALLQQTLQHVPQLGWRYGHITFTQESHALTRTHTHIFISDFGNILFLFLDSTNITNSHCPDSLQREPAGSL